jgi:sugar phosphate isomerase/epimerase
MKIGLYSISYQGQWYRGSPVPLKELIPKVANFGFDGISISGKRQHGSPLDLNDTTCQEIKELAESCSLELAVLDSYSNFMDPIIEHREAQLVWFRELIRLSNKLEIDIIKIFSGWMGTTLRNGVAAYDMLWRHLLPYATSYDRWNWIKDCITECTRWAEDYGITLALQNHGPPFRPGYEDALEMIKAINADNLKMCLDIGLGCMSDAQQTDEYLTEAVEACRDFIIYSHYNGKFKETSAGVVQEGYDIPFSSKPGGSIMNYPAFIRELKKIGYKGYLAYEVCGPVTINYQHQGLAEVDRLVKSAYSYMRNLIET